MNKKKMLAMSLIASLMLCPLCSCGMDEQASDAANADAESGTTSIQTTVKKVPEIIVGESKVKANTVESVSETASVESVTASTAESDSGTNEVTSVPEMQNSASDVTVQELATDMTLSPDEAKEYIIRTVDALKHKDYESAMRWCNFGDVIRLSDKTNQRPMTDDEIVTKLKYGNYDMSEFDESIRELEQAGDLKASDFGEPVPMTEEELKELNDFLQGELFKDSNFRPQYKNGWKIPTAAGDAQQAAEERLKEHGENYESLAYLYILEDSTGEWRMDIGLNYTKVMYNAIHSKAVTHSE